VFDSPVAIRNITTSSTPASGDVYDLQGRRVSNPKKGVYIQDGRKIVRQ